MLDPGLWWLVPFTVLILVMLHAMMEFTVSLLVERPVANRRPVPSAELRQRLLAANEPAQGYRLVEGKDCDLEVHWQHTEIPLHGRLAIAKTASSGRLRLLLDEQRHELRMNEVTRTYYYFLGFAGWLPAVRAFAGVQSGPPGQALAEQLGRIANQGGWTVRPVLWWFQATFRGHYWLRKLTPPPLRRWPARRLWGILYPLSYALAMACPVLGIGSLERSDILLLVGISAFWWGIWGLLTWTLCGFPAFWRRKRR